MVKYKSTLFQIIYVTNFKKFKIDYKTVDFNNIFDLSEMLQKIDWYYMYFNKLKNSHYFRNYIKEDFDIIQNQKGPMNYYDIFLILEALQELKGKFIDVRSLPF